jgi:7-carboxy-7-deazaguanine synthase
MSNKIPVIECFGATIQGEGMVIGQKTMFVRTAGCDYSCSWCDSKFTWDGSEKEKIRMLTAEEIILELERIGGNNFNHVTISGGNPALIGKGMDEFIDLIHQKGHRVGLETQGSKWQDWFLKIDDLTISPKPPSSLMTTNFEILDSIIQRLTTEKVNFSLKIVVFDDKDFDYAKEIHKRYGNVPMYLSVGNPTPYSEGNMVNELLNRLGWLFDKVIQDHEMNNVRSLPQLHTLIWGNKREV